MGCLKQINYLTESKPTLKVVWNRSNFEHPFGMLMPGRHANSENYRYGFQNQEVDNEIKGTGNSVNYKYRMHDPRLGRFFAVDPMARQYPELSTYQFAANQVIHAKELEGLENSAYFDANGNWMASQDGNSSVRDRATYNGTFGFTFKTKILKVDKRSWEDRFVAYWRNVMGSGTEWDTFNKSFAINAAEILPGTSVVIGLDKAISGEDKARSESLSDGERGFEGSMAALDIVGLGALGKLVKGAKYVDEATDVVKNAIKNADGPLHHIATNKNSVSAVRGGPWTPKFEEFFVGAGLDIDKASTNLVNVLGHKGPHPEAYHQYVFDKLTTATKGLQSGTDTYRNAVTGALNQVSKEAQTTGSQVNKWLIKE